MTSSFSERPDAKAAKRQAPGTPGPLRHSGTWALANLGGPLCCTVQEVKMEFFNIIGASRFFPFSRFLALP